MHSTGNVCALQAVLDKAAPDGALPILVPALRVTAREGSAYRHGEAPLARHLHAVAIKRGKP
ncbi:hypothetical protein [Sphingomonas sp. IC081]|uniref:hypothetical protein n=1 Tax=Sphingomonas sp. IC081 TaxID=304378 RepID=UPI00115BA489|nr:hypothetical protein [Sphingomonas sp. IC081]